jgi:hypothetical protein
MFDKPENFIYKSVFVFAGKHSQRRSQNSLGVAYGHSRSAVSDI